tara:strand:+ start:5291 stop:6034 length:744 start_codon:yes stop_codon:yes gene_type:complete
MTESLIESEAVETEAPAEAERDFVVAGDSEPERPDWLPEKYNTPEDLAKAYKSLESKIGAKDQDLRDTILGELKEEAFANRPETAGDYELPDTVDADTAVDSGLLNWWSEHAHENGYSQDEFKKGIEMYMESSMGDSGPDLEAESAKLGDNANDRITSASLFATKFFPQDAMPAIERMCESAEGILALEHIAEAMKDGSFSGNSAPQSGASESDLREMMKDDRYHSPAHRDPAFVKQVEAGFKKLYG